MKYRDIDELNEAVTELENAYRNKLRSLIAFQIGTLAAQTVTLVFLVLHLFQ